MSARTLIWSLALGIGLTAGAVSFINVLKAFNEIKLEASLQQAEMLAASINASLQTDLLSSNFYLASERLKSMLEPRQWSAYCVIVHDNQESGVVLKIGNDAVCGNHRLTQFDRTVFFDAEKKEPAYIITVSSDPDLLPYKPSTKIIIVLLGSLLILFLALILVILMSNLFLAKVLSILRESEGGQISRWFSLLFEFDAIYKIIAERDEQSALAQRAIANVELANAVNQMATQVSHDIRSPLSALNIVIGSLKDISEEKRSLIRNATQRITDIANQLLKTSIGSSVARDNKRSIESSAALAPIIDSVVYEKKLQFGEITSISIATFLAGGSDVFASINGVEFARVISNLIDNSVESLNGVGEVLISLSTDISTVTIKIQDNGKGIPPHLLSRLGERGASFGKSGGQSGFGLGVYHARKTILDAGGSFNVVSEVDVGTVVTIGLIKMILT